MAQAIPHLLAALARDRCPGEMLGPLERGFRHVAPKLPILSQRSNCHHPGGCIIRIEHNTFAFMSDNPAGPHFGRYNGQAATAGLIGDLRTAFFQGGENENIRRSID
jgi:hypothetical protein